MTANDSTPDAIAARIERSERAIEELPDERQYKREADARLDRVLEEAIDASEHADKTTLACVLRFELATLHLERGTEIEEVSG